MAQYLVLIYEDEAGLASASQDEFAQLLAEHAAFGDRNRAALRGGHALHGTDTATSIRRDAGVEIGVTDGPFAETKEALTGYYVIEADDLDAAIAIARQVPTPYGGVEVRPVRVFE